MMYALANCDIYTGDEVLFDRAVMIRDSIIEAIVPFEEIPGDARRIDLGGQIVAPGFIDVQVNGGAGRLFNNSPTVAALEAIVEGHRKFGTTDLLPTFITGDRAKMQGAALCVQAWLERGSPGVLGIHFEGPFISPDKTGVHDKKYVRPATDEDLAIITSVNGGVTLVTLAPEIIDFSIIRSLSGKGVLISAGHSGSTYEVASKALEGGVKCTTHLFNAMTQFSSREPGLVGAALDHRHSWASIIVDGHHVHFASVRVAWRAKERGKLFLVTDAMPPVGSPDMREFSLGPHEIRVEGGRCITKDGVLAGSALDMATAVRNCIQKVGIPTDEALRMASTYPAEFLGLGKSLGRIRPGYRANLAIFNNQIRVSSVVVNGEHIAFH